jgi:hypothetical protein
MRPVSLCVGLALACSACTPILKADFQGPNDINGALPAIEPASSADDAIQFIPTAQDLSGWFLRRAPASFGGGADNLAFQMLGSAPVGAGAWFASELISFRNRSKPYRASLVVQNFSRGEWSFGLLQNNLFSFGTANVSETDVTVTLRDQPPIVLPVATYAQTFKLSFVVRPDENSVRVSIQVYGGPSQSVQHVYEEGELPTLNRMIVSVSQNDPENGAGNILVDKVTARPAPRIRIGFGSP